MKGIAKAPGSCGELVQGTIDNMNFLITCPINCYSQITVELNRSDCLAINDPSRYKVLQAVTKTMLHINGKIGGAYITVNSRLPISKGMASSTADIAAASLATAHTLKYDLSPQELSQIALSIEPSDGLFFPGIVAFDHIKGKYYKKIGTAIDLDLLVYDVGGVVDTILFNQRPDLKEKNRLKEMQVKKAFKLVEKGFQKKRPELVAQGATISALANQPILYKPHLEEIIDLVVKNGALGINTAHSGTLIGILFEKEKIDVEKLHNQVVQKYAQLKYIGHYQLINGGVIPEKGEEPICSKFESMVAT